MDTAECLQNAINFIESDLSRKPDYTQIAKRACMSGFHFQRIFSAVFGFTVGEYIRNRRLTLACAELLSSEKSVTEIALSYGYDTPEGFSRAFCRFFGFSPSAARSRGCELETFEKISVSKILRGDTDKMDDMSSYAKRGYYVRGNSPVYFTRDMEKTCAWFRDVLGWYGDICGKNDDGSAVYGCVFDYPGELIVTNLTPFRGIHLFNGEPVKGVVGFISVQGLDKLHTLVKDNGWDKITEITAQPWGARECAVTTPDGCVIRFFETTD